MDDTFQSMMREATRLTRSGRLTEATQIIQRAMSKAAPPAAQPGSAAASPFTEGDVLEGLVRVLSDDDVADLEPQPEAEAETETEAGPAAHAVGESFVTGVFSRDSQDHHYKLYSPPRQATNAPLPLVVMLHGCTQNPDDFALGTGMTEAARGGANAPAFYVVYPSQPRSANAQG
ncbi:MAG: esterase, partial [Pseudorhodobacter sp.]|nr:esterase [Rhizobacter sp.]